VLHQRVDRALRSRIRGERADRGVRTERRQQDDAAALAPGSGGNCWTRKKRRPDVDGEQVVEVFHRGVLDRCSFGHSCIGDQDVQAIADDFADLLGKLVRAVRGGQVGADSIGAATGLADFSDDGLGFRSAAAVVNREPAPRPSRGRARWARADAAGGTRNEGGSCLRGWSSLAPCLEVSRMRRNLSASCRAASAVSLARPEPLVSAHLGAIADPPDNERHEEAISRCPACARGRRNLLDYANLKLVIVTACWVDALDSNGYFPGPAKALLLRYQTVPTYNYRDLCSQPACLGFKDQNFHCSLSAPMPGRSSAPHDTPLVGGCTRNHRVGAHPLIVQSASLALGTSNDTGEE